MSDKSNQYKSLYVNQQEVKNKSHDENESQAQKRARLRFPVVYTAIRQEGEDELARPASSLWWSGIAAGLAIFFSVISIGALTAYQDKHGAPDLLVHLGYCVGFLMVILGRLQLFTENTITAVIPVLSYDYKGGVRAMLRLWTIVFAANMLGVFIGACASYYGQILPPMVLNGMLEVSHHYMQHDPAEFFTRAIAAGFLVAALVWMMPSARGSEFLLIIVMTYLISMLGLTHVIAGSGEAFIMLLAGEVTIGFTIFGAILPTLAGNVLGGTLLFTMLAYGQVHKEI